MVAFNNTASFPRPRLADDTGFTITEMLVSLVVFSLVMLAWVSGMIALERSFNAVDFYSTDIGDQSRVFDYINRDVRSSLTSQSPQVIVGSGSLQVTIPQYYSTSGTVITPTISGSTASYGASPTVVTYALNGTKLTRTSGNTTPVVLSQNIASFTPVVDYTDDPSGDTIKVTITFNSEFRTGWTTMGTTISSMVTVRN